MIFGKKSAMMAGRLSRMPFRRPFDSEKGINFVTRILEDVKAASYSVGGVPECLIGRIKGSPAHITFSITDNIVTLRYAFDTDAVDEDTRSNAFNLGSGILGIDDELCDFLEGQDLLGNTISIGSTTCITFTVGPDAPIISEIPDLCRWITTSLGLSI